MGRLLGGIKWEPRAQPKVVLVIPWVHVTEAPHDHVVVGVMYGVPDGHIFKYMTVSTKYAIRQGPHILALTDHDPHPIVPRPRNLASKEVLCHII